MVFRRLGRQFRNLLSREQNLEERIQHHREERSPLQLEDEELYLQIEPLTATLEEAKTAARGEHWAEAVRALHEHFHDRIRPSCFVHHGEVDAMVDSLKAFTSDCRKQVKACEDILQHRFSPLGCKPHQFSNTIDWFSDFAGQSWLFGHVEVLRDTLLKPAQEGSEDSGAMELTWSFNQLGHFVDLARAYWISGNESLASEFIVQAVDWSDKNPPLFGVNWLNPRVIAVRTMNCMLATLMFMASPQMQGDVFARLLRTLLLHGATLANLLDQGTTHRLAVASSLALLCGHFPEFVASKRWNTLARENLLPAYDEEFSSDGMHRSGATGAHREALEWLLLVLTLDRLNSRGGEVLHRPVEMAAEALVYLKPAVGPFQDIGSNFGEGFMSLQASPTEHVHRLLALSAVALGRHDLGHVAHECPSELLWWLGPEAGDRFGELGKEEPKGVRRLFREAGIAVCRDHWGPRANWCCMLGYRRAQKNKPYLPLSPAAHPWHDDALSLSLVLDGEPAFIEPGAPSAPGEDLTQALARLLSHTTARVGREMEPVSLSPEASEIQFTPTLESVKDGYLMTAERPVWLLPERPYVLRREVLFLPKVQRLIWRDHFSGEGEVHYETNLLLAPHLDVLMRGDMGCLLRGKKLQARIIPLFPGRFRYEQLKGKADPFGGWYWQDGVRPGPTNLLRYFSRLKAPFTISMWLAWNPSDSLSPRQQDVDKLFR